MRLTLEALHVLDAIDRKGSFAAAAEELHRVPSAITYTVQRLEKDLGVKLFDRTGHRAVLTEAGKELLREGRQMLRAAHALEARVKRVATGWEAELRIAFDDILPVDPLLELVGEFYRAECGSRIRLQAEVLGGCWDALLSDRADLVIGAPGEGPPGGGYITRPLAPVEFVFAVAPNHPLASAEEPLSRELILQHRSVAAADTSRELPVRTTGLLPGQEVLTVHNMSTKALAQALGLGVGYLPRHIAEPYLAAGRLIEKQTQEAKAPVPLFLAWRTSHRGKALSWFVERIEGNQRFLERLRLSG
ncbi:LysR family transcriptional regulator [Pelomicrobium methylotrophicum]|nr:LysR family transcriptional regulator [Pelomicrobium methylotrophicum]